MLIKSKALLASLCLMLPAFSARALTVIVDFNDPTQGTTSTYFSGGTGAPTVDTFDVTGFGFLEADRSTIYASIMAELENDFYGIPTSDVDAMSPIPAGMELDIDFEIGDFGNAPANGDTEYYYVQVGDHVSGDFGTSLGVAARNRMRDASGNPSITGRMVGSIHTDRINSLGLPFPGNQLTSGDLSATTHAINGTLVHEIGHALSLLHLNNAGAVTFSGLSPLMGTGAIDLPNVERITDRDFSYSGFNDQDGGAAQFHVQQLVNAIGLRSNMAAVPEPTTAIPLIALALFARLRRK